jgi:hypothetical protein
MKILKITRWMFNPKDFLREGTESAMVGRTGDGSETGITWCRSELKEILALEGEEREGWLEEKIVSSSEMGTRRTMLWKKGWEERNSGWYGKMVSWNITFRETKTVWVGGDQTICNLWCYKDSQWKDKA